MREPRLAYGRTGIVVLVALLFSLAAACGGSDEGAGGGRSCPNGTDQRQATNEIEGPGAGSREDAIRTELENLGIGATEDAISEGVVHAAPSGNGGTEDVTIESSDGTLVTMTLAPIDPGWAVEASTWCAPA